MMKEKAAPDDYVKVIILLAGLGEEYQLIATILSSDFDNEKMDLTA